MTRISLCSLLAASVLLIAQPSAASEQSLLLRMPLASCAVPFKDAPTAAEALDLIKEAAEGVGTNDAGKPVKGAAYLIHVIDYNHDSSIKQQRWFVYDAGAIKETDRIFGRKNLKVVSVHRGIPGLTRSQLLTAIPGGLKRQVIALRASVAAETQAKAASEDPDIVAKHSQNIRTLEEKLHAINALEANAVGQNALADRALTGDSTDIGDGLNELTIAGNGDRSLTLINDVLVDERFKPLADLAYRIDVATKTPAPVENLKSILSLVQPTGMSAPQTIAVELNAVNFCSLASATLDRLPADVKVTAVVTEKEKEKSLGTKTFDDEGKYWYDFSFALPMTSYSDVTIDSTNSTLTATNVKKSSLFAVAALGLPRDTKRPGWNWPVFIYGLPMSGRAIHHHLTAAAFGFGPVQLFWGYLHNRDQVTASTADADPDDVLAESSSTSPSGASKDVMHDWSHPRAFGVILQISRVIDLFKKK